MIDHRRITFGIVGGIGPIAGADLFFKFVKSTPAYDDSEHFNVILEQQPLREKSVFADELYDPAPRKMHIFSVIQQLVARKANCIILSCFISHTFLHELENSINVPIINMMEGLRHHVQSRYADKTRIGVLTSDYVRRRQLFEGYFPSGRFHLIYPDADIQKRCLMPAVYGTKGIKAGHLTGAVIENLEKACSHLFSKGADLILPGFTEIPVVYDALQKKTKFPIIDANQVYADWAIRHYSRIQPKKQCKIGIIGGLGPSATVDLMDKIVKNTPAEKDQDHYKIIVEHNPQIPDRTAYLLQDAEDPTIPLFTCAKNLEKREADFIAIPCNTAHAFIDRIQKYLSIPIVHMIEEVAAYIQKHFPATTAAGLLATTGTIKTGIYHKVFAGTDIRLVTPDEIHQQFVMEAIYGEKGVKAGFRQGAAREHLLKAAGYLVDKGTQVLILGCTELPLIMEANDRFPFGAREAAILDPTNILAQKCVSLLAAMNRGDPMD
jgi:aspartate racemase